MPDMSKKPPVPPPRAPGQDWPEIKNLGDLAKVAENWFANPTDLEWDEVFYVMDGIRRLAR